MGVSCNWWRVLNRRKVLDSLALGNSDLARVLTTFDLTALGVGSTLGVGVYVLAGNVSKNIAGPAVVVSFLIAAIASVFAGLCYAEFGARVPRAGSAYVYSYVCVGEFTAFIIGWNLILEYVIGSASVAKGLSKYLDSLLNETMENTFLETMPISKSSIALSPYFDTFAFAVSVVLAVALALGVKESSTVNSLFTIINVGVVLFVIIAGSFKADPRNWKIKKEDIHIDNPEDAGEGGFFPFGVSGAIKGAATCFYGFIGFDCVATTGEEVKNPQKAIPIAIIVSLTIIFLSYFGVSTVLTLMWPYYLQDSDAPLPKVFIEIGWPVAQWIVTIGGMFGLCASLFGAMFPLPRIIYAMAMDGLIFRFLGQVHHYFRTPLYGTLIAGLLTGIMAAIFNLDQLVNMMSIGTLLAYTIVSTCVLLLRYTDLDMYGGSDISSEYIESTNLVTLKEHVSFGTVLKQLFNSSRKKYPTFLSSNVVTAEVLAFCVLSTLLCVCLIFWEHDLVDLNAWALSVTSVIAGFLVLILLSVSLQPTSSKPLHFKVPFVPVVPAASILVNIYLMLKLDADTWIRFGVWMAIGFVIYFLCGMKKIKASCLNNEVMEHQSANRVLNEDSESLKNIKVKHKLSESQTTITTDYKNPEQGIMTEMHSPVTISATNNALLSQYESVLNPILDSKMKSDDLQSVTHMESIVECNAVECNYRKTTAAGSDAHYVTELESKNSVTTHTAALSSIDKSSVVEEATMSTVPHVSASVMFPPADVSLSSECVQTVGVNDFKRSRSVRSARNLYRNVIIISHDSVDGTSEQDIQKVPEHGEYGVDFETEEPRTVTSAIFDKREPFSDSQDTLAGLKQNTNTKGSETNTDLRMQSTFLQPLLPPLPPPPPPPPPPPLPLPPPLPIFTPSAVTGSLASRNLSRRVSDSGNDLNTFLVRSSNIKSRTEPSTPVTADPQFLLSTGNLKSSDFASKLEAMLQGKIYNVKYDKLRKNPQLFTKNSTSSGNSDDKGNVNHHQTVVATNANEREEAGTDSVAESKVIQSEADEKFLDRKTELINIKGKLEQFLANRANTSVPKVPPIHPNLSTVVANNDEIKHKNEDTKYDFKQHSKNLLLNESEKLKLKDENNNFDVVRKQRLLMGEVLSSLKFVVSKNRADSETGSIS